MCCAAPPLAEQYNCFFALALAELSSVIAPLHCTCPLLCRAVQLLLFDRRNVPLTESNWDAAAPAIIPVTRVSYSLVQLLLDVLCSPLLC